MIVTFYSYKGGVGRTMALANIATLLAEDQPHNQRVLLWDFDLEAPGLHRLHPPKDAADFRQGFVDLAYRYATSDEVDDLGDYIYSSHIDGIDVLPAGKVDAAYCDKLLAINWSGFFSEDPHSPGPFFGRILQWINEAKYDYVLIDSRTGLNDVAGICTQVLPDVVVVLFRLNDQNIDGVAHVAATIREELRRRDRSTRVLPVASVVLSQSTHDNALRRDRIKEIFEVPDVDYIRFDADLVADEKLFCRREVRDLIWPPPPVVFDYNRLCRLIRRLNPEDTRTAIQLLPELIEKGDDDRSRDIVRHIVQRRPDLPDAWEYLRHFAYGEGDEKSIADSVVDSVADQRNVRVLEWRAAKLAAEAEGPDAPELRRAFELLTDSAALAPGDMQIAYGLYQVAAVIGDMEVAIRALRRCSEASPQNIGLLGELVDLYIRRGANYFILATEILESNASLPQTVLAVIWAFLGEDAKANEAVNRWRQSTRFSPEFFEVISAHMELARGNRDEAIGRGREATDGIELKISRGQLANWAEFFICAEDFQRARNMLSALRQITKVEGVEDIDGLERLTDLLEGVADNYDDRVAAAWSRQNWRFTELLVFRERIKRDDPHKYGPRLDIIEKLSRYQLLNAADARSGSVFWRRGMKGRARPRFPRLTRQLTRVDASNWEAFI